MPALGCRLCDILSAMATVDLTLPHHRYEIHIEPGALTQLGEQVRTVAPHERAALIVDEAIADSHGRVAGRRLTPPVTTRASPSCHAVSRTRRSAPCASLYDVLLEHHLERKSPIIALGGGITGDTVGFVAATYLRGVPFIQCPTTLLAMVDASVGGKVGVNVPQGKNLIGAFYQPRLVAIDPQTFATLPGRELRCGLAECIKHAVIRHPELFDWIEAHVEAIQRLDETDHGRVDRTQRAHQGGGGDRG